MAYYNSFISIISLFYPSLIWEKKTKHKKIYLTFDDGPIPIVTDFVLEQLKIFNVQATFFCVGENIKKNPDEFLKIVLAGHSIGNHTYHHLKGWDTKDDLFLENVQACDKIIEDTLSAAHLDKSFFREHKLFRPPYGKIKKSQIKSLQESFHIVMWNVLTGDFDQNQKPETCLKNSIDHTRPGSIVIFHDSLKAEKNLRYALPRYLKYFREKDYQFRKL